MILSYVAPSVVILTKLFMKNLTEIVCMLKDRGSIFNSNCKITVISNHHAFTVGFLKDSVAVLLTADPHLLSSQL